jgi:hypothetical protein
MRGNLFQGSTPQTTDWNIALNNAIAMLPDTHGGIEAERRRTGCGLPCTKCGLRPRMTGHTWCYPCKKPSIIAAAKKRRREKPEEVRAYHRTAAKAAYKLDPKPYLKRAKAYRDKGMAKRDAAKAREKLADYYVRRTLVNNSPGLRIKDIPQSLVETQRIVLKLKRSMKHGTPK